MNFFSFVVLVAWLLLFPVSGFSQDNESTSEFTADRYFITFESSAGLIDPPNPANKVPMGQHSSGQSKEALAQTLGLNGDILNIFDALNAIYVRMDAQEAERWRQDERVQIVEQEGAVAVFLAENEDTRTPHYNNESLKVPVVDADTQPALFQDGEFVFDASINAWRLVTFRVTPVIEKLIKNVELIKTDSNPAQVFLKISAPDIACNTPGRIGMRKTGNRFDVSAGFTSPPPGTTCAAVVVPFEVTVPLPVFGLPAGIYEYNVNSEFVGSFELTEDNTL
ncbi:MAG: hypothetical protein IT525_12105 [Nitrosomonas sp.]|nr:hypothetical protein [Nitrosomonas sp.]